MLYTNAVLTLTLEESLGMFLDLNLMDCFNNFFLYLGYYDVYPCYVDISH